MQRVTAGQRFRYWFDNAMSRGTSALIGLLALVSLVLIIVIGVVMLVFGITDDSGEAQDPVGLLWGLFNHTIDSGALGGDKGNAIFLGTMLLTTLGGIFIVSSLISVLSSGLDARLDELRKGRSFVIEQGHTLILGWSDQVFPIISELIIANANQRRPRIVILADKDKVEMEDEIRARVGPTGKTRIVCRTGNPIDLDDLAIVNPQGTRSIIILAPADADPDAQVIKTTLAITNNPRRRAAPYHIVAVIQDARNLEAARVVGKREAQFIDASDLVSRLMAQTCRQVGLSVIYTELLDFGGDEIYFQEEPALVGKTFGEALSAYEKCAVLGVQTTDGTVVVKPPMERPFATGERVIAVAADDDQVRVSSQGRPAIDPAAMQAAVPATVAPEQILLLGWNRRAPVIINELDHYVAPGSTVTVVADVADAAEVIARRCPNLQRLTVHVESGDTSDRSTLERIGARDYNHIVILCYSDTIEPQRADAKTLITLLHLRDIEAQAGERYSIVSEMLDDRNRALAEVAKADDFIVSDKLISLLIAQLSENPALMAVFGDLFDPQGAEIYLRPAADYIRPDTPVSFYTVIAAAQQRDEVALGYVVAAEAADAAASYGVHLNPAKSVPVRLMPADRIVVLAEE
jgi:voltage-gated potassium channel Kch